MSRKTQFKSFNLTVTLRHIEIGKDGSGVLLNPAECARVKTLLHTSTSAGSGGARGYLQSSPFRLLFDPDSTGRRLIKRGMKQEEGLRFDASLTDELVEAINVSLMIHRDVNLHKGGGSTAQVRQAFEVPDPPIDGRD